MKKLIPALCMLLVAAALLGTSTYAWFSMNTEVEATGMSVKAASDAASLVIANTAGGTFAADVEADEAITTIKPAAHDTFANVGDVSTPAKWYYGYSDNPTDHTLVDATKTALTSIDGYLATFTFFVKVAPSADGQTPNNQFNLKLKTVAFSNQTAGMKAIFVGPNGYEEVGPTGSVVGTVLASTVTTAEVPITVYLYIDGNNTNVTTDNLANLTGNVGFTLTTSLTNS